MVGGWSPARNRSGSSASSPDFLDRIRAAVMVTSFDGTVLYANPYCEVLYGRSPEELSGQPSGDFAAAPLEASTLNEIGAALLSGQSWEGDFGVVRKDGAVIEVHAVNSPLFDDAGVVAGVVSIAFDITRRRRDGEPALGAGRAGPGDPKRR